MPFGDRGRSDSGIMRQAERFAEEKDRYNSETSSLNVPQRTIRCLIFPPESENVTPPRGNSAPSGVATGLRNNLLSFKIGMSDNKISEEESSRSVGLFKTGTIGGVDCFRESSAEESDEENRENCVDKKDIKNISSEISFYGIIKENRNGKKKKLKFF